MTTEAMNYLFERADRAIAEAHELRVANRECVRRARVTSLDVQMQLSGMAEVRVKTKPKPDS